MTLSTTEDDYVRSMMYLMQPGVAFPIELFEANERTIAAVENP